MNAILQGATPVRILTALRQQATLDPNVIPALKIIRAAKGYFRRCLNKKFETSLHFRQWACKYKPNDWRNCSEQAPIILGEAFEINTQQGMQISVQGIDRGLMIQTQNG